MTSTRHIPWFNPREMDDETVLALSTGRDILLAEILGSIEVRAEYPGQLKHWLITGPRGAGKSFFLRLLQASFLARMGTRARFVLLPEEFPNIYSPHELLQEILRLLEPVHYSAGAAAQWKVADAAKLWNETLKKLLDAFSEPLLVVGIENFDTLLTQAFSNDVDSSRLRHLMSNETRIMFVATAVQGGFDENYNQRLFRQFEHRNLSKWSAADHRHYLFSRARQQGRNLTPQQLNRIDAYSRYTGGSPRAAAILAATILDVDNPLTAANDLDTAIEKMSDYYRALIDRIPSNTRKLFDALIRGGEPASQTELAERTGARQNDISRAFLWLLDNAYVSEHREPGQKTKQYRVQDRLLVQFYRMRYLHPGRRSRLAIMTDLLADTLSFRDKWQFASRYVNTGHDSEALSLVDLALKDRQIDINLLPADWHSPSRLLGVWAFWERHESLGLCSGSQENHAQLMQNILHMYRTDTELKTAIEQAAILARASKCQEMRGEELVALIENDLSLCPAAKLAVYSSMIGDNRNPAEWLTLKKVFESEDILIKYQLSISDVSATYLKQAAELYKEYPLTTSFHLLASECRNSPDNVKAIPLFIAAGWAVKAALGWQAAKQSKSLEQTMALFVQLCEKSLSSEYAPEKILACLDDMEPLYSQIVFNYHIWALEQRGRILIDLNKPNSAYQAFKTLRELWIDYKNEASGTVVKGWDFALEGMAWCLGMKGNFEEALKLHHQAVSESSVEGNTRFVAWNLGQIARYLCRKNSVAVAWQELDKSFKRITGCEVEAITELADAVFDIYNQEGEAQAFAVGVEIFQGVARRPAYSSESILRGMYLTMLEMSVPFTLLSDLLDEWPGIWPEPDYPGIALLRNILLTWLDDLQQTPAEREAKRKNLDPDLATTLIELEKALPPHTRHRLGLL